MTLFSLIAALVGGMIAIGGAQAVTGLEKALISADEITRAFVGKTCVTRTGATFTFTNDGHYGYDGLWTNSGHYSVHDGGITVILDSGLERSFAISKKGEVFFIEETPLSCR